MWQPAVVRFGVIALVAIACGSGKRQDTIGNSGGKSGDLTAAYFCSIQDGDFKYPRFPCAVRQIDGHWMLAKLAGTQRFRGEVVPQRDGFSFAGEFYCPYGDCTQPLHGMFTDVGGGKLRGTFTDAAMIIVLEPAPDSAFGGASYGGDSYGGFGYGGATYGTPRPRNRRH